MRFTNLAKTVRKVSGWVGEGQSEGMGYGYGSRIRAGENGVRLQGQKGAGGLMGKNRQGVKPRKNYTVRLSEQEQKILTQKAGEELDRISEE